MSILIIGVGTVGARIADKINELKISGVNCAVVVNGVDTEEYPSIVNGVDIWDGEMRGACGEKLAQELAENNIEQIKTLIVDGTNKDWSAESE